MLCYFPKSCLTGDGNFAVVRICKDKSSGKEYALKVIDKAKCKGKEYYVEAEVCVAIATFLSHPYSETSLALF